MKKLLFVLCTFIMLLSCERGSDDVKKEEKVKSYHSSSNRVAGNDTYIDYLDKSFKLNLDNSVAYYENHDLVGNILFDTENIQITEDSSTGDITVLNTITRESFIMTNIRYTETSTVFDVYTEEGYELVDLEAYNSNQFNNKIPIKPIIQAAVAIISVVSYVINSNISQSDCMSSMPKNCGGGLSPYAIYTSGWFSSTCEAGCR